VFTRLQIVMGDLDPRDFYPAIDRAFAQAWDDPKMSIYDNYEQHKKST